MKNDGKGVTKEAKPFEAIELVELGVGDGGDDGTGAATGDGTGAATLPPLPQRQQQRRQEDNGTHPNDQQAPATTTTTAPGALAVRGPGFRDESISSSDEDEEEDHFEEDGILRLPGPTDAAASTLDQQQHNDDILIEAQLVEDDVPIFLGMQIPHPRRMSRRLSIMAAAIIILIALVGTLATIVKSSSSHNKNNQGMHTTTTDDENALQAKEMLLAQFKWHFSYMFSGYSPADMYGFSVSLSADGNTAAIGSPAGGGLTTGAGIVEVLHWSGHSRLGNLLSAANGTQRQQEGRSAQFYGFSSSLSADGRVVAAAFVSQQQNEHGDNGRSLPVVGIVQMYEWQPKTLSRKQIGQDIVGNRTFHYSQSCLRLSEDGRTVAIAWSSSSLSSPGGGDDFGFVQVYHRQGDAWALKGNSTAIGLVNFQRAEILPYQAQDGPHAGFSVALSNDGSTLAIGSPVFYEKTQNRYATFNSTVQVYGWSAGDQGWKPTGNVITGQTSFEEAGRSISLSANGRIVAIGSPRDRHGNAAGQVRVYQLTGHGVWDQMGELIVGLSKYDSCGFSISLSDDGKTLAVGCPQEYAKFSVSADADRGSWAGFGLVRTYRYLAERWMQIGGSVGGFAGLGIFTDFGASVALSSDGSILASGAPYNADMNFTTDSGAVGFFLLLPPWRRVGNIIESQYAYNGFGDHVSLSGDGKSLCVSSLARTVHLFQWNDGQWEEANIDFSDQISDDVDRYAGEISSNGLTLAMRVGDGRAQVYRRAEANGAWVKTKRDIVGLPEDEYRGVLSMSADGQVVAIGAPECNSGDRFTSGCVRVFSLSDNGDWEQIGDDIKGEQGVEAFGSSVSVSANGTTLAAGNFLTGYVDENGAIHLNPNESGAVSVFRLLRNTRWEQLGNTINAQANSDQLSLSMDGTQLVIGNSRASNARVFRLDGNNTWTQVGSNIFVRGEKNFGSSVSMSRDGSIVAVGAPDSKFVCIFKILNVKWVQHGRCVTGKGGYFGSSVSLSADGSTLAIGVPDAGLVGINFPKGQVHAFKIASLSDF